MPASSEASPARRHAVLGAGAVGLALGATLARQGHQVVLGMREETLARYPGVIRVTSRLRPGFTVPAEATDRLPGDADVLWVTVKAPALAAALDRVPPDASPGLVIPLLNGLDHLPVLRARFGDRVAAGAIRIEAERTGPGEMAWHSLFGAIDLATDNAGGRDGRLGTVQAELRTAGWDCTADADTPTVLWRKLVMLLPLALATTAAGGPLGAVRRDAELHALLLAAAREAAAVAAAERVAVDLPGCLRALDTLPGRTDSSLHRDAAAGRRPTELAALAGPVQRLAAANRLATPAITALAERAARAGA